MAGAFRDAHRGPGKPAGLEVGRGEQVPGQVGGVVQLRGVRVEVGFDGFLLEQLGAQPALHGAGLDACAQVPHRLDAPLHLVHRPVALDDLRGERDEHDRGRGVQAR